jgi:hypothetical protein
MLGKTSLRRNPKKSLGGFIEAFSDVSSSWLASVYISSKHKQNPPLQCEGSNFDGDTGTVTKRQVLLGG